MVIQTKQNEEMKIRIVPQDWHYLDASELIFDYRGV